MRFVGVCAFLLGSATLLSWVAVEKAAAHSAGGATQLAPITIDYPPASAVLPRELPSLTFRWRDTANPVALWRIVIAFADGSPEIDATTAGDRMQVGEIDRLCIAPLNELPTLTPEEAAGRIWVPEERVWQEIRKHSAKTGAAITITGYADQAATRPVSTGRSVFTTSEDPIQAPIFYRDVPLIPANANGQLGILPKDAIALIKWRLRDVAEPSSRTVLEGLPTCANCHSFSADGKTLGIDVDGPMNDKSLYAVVPVREETEIRNRDVYRWNTTNDQQGGRKLRAAFMSQVSPDGRYVLTTIDERDPMHLNRAYGLEEKYYFTVYRDYRFGQVFFPTRGILAWRDVATGRTEPLPGADDPRYVQTDGVWSRDGKWIVFARAEAVTAFPPGAQPAVFANDPHETQIQYSLYRIPFNGGRGGRPEAVTGASNNGMSNNFPKISPDGRWIVFVRCRNGQLMRPDSQLYIVPWEGGEARLMNCNTRLMNSWHSFSPNGRWMVFSSKARSPYTQLYLTHLDPDGNDSPPILIENTQAANRAANIPEFVNIAPDAFRKLEIPAADFYRVFDVASDLMMKGRIPDALPEWRKAVELDPEDERARVNLGIAMDYVGLLNEAIEQFRKAIAIAPEHAEAYDNLARDLLLRGNLDEAIEAYSKGLTIDPNNAGAQANLGTALYQKGRVQEAIEHCEKAIEIEKALPDAHNTLGLAYSRLGRLDEAIDHLQTAVAENAGSMQYQYNLGRVLAQKGRFQDAIPHMERAAALSNSNEPEILSYLAAVYADAGRLAEAIDTATRARDLANRSGASDLAAALDARIARYKTSASNGGK
jgi:tetratricopeptide (TPR) repeat protein